MFLTEWREQERGGQIHTGPPGSTERRVEWGRGESAYLRRLLNPEKTHTPKSTDINAQAIYH